MENLVSLNNSIKSNAINDEKKYWDIIYDMRWYFLSREKGFNANDEIAKYLTNNLSRSQIENLFNFVVDKRKYLEDRVKSFLNFTKNWDSNQYNLSEEKIFDLCSHIVGLGEVTYYYVLHHIDIIKEYEKDIQKCFEYGFDIALYNINNKMSVN